MKIYGGKQMTNKHNVEKIKYLKILQAETLETVHTHTHQTVVQNKK